MARGGEFHFGWARNKQLTQTDRDIQKLIEYHGGAITIDRIAKALLIPQSKVRKSIEKIRAQVLT